MKKPRGPLQRRVRAFWEQQRPWERLPGMGASEGGSPEAGRSPRSGGRKGGAPARGGAAGGGGRWGRWALPEGAWSWFPLQREAPGGRLTQGDVCQTPLRPTSHILATPCTAAFPTGPSLTQEQPPRLPGGLSDSAREACREPRAQGLTSPRVSLPCGDTASLALPPSLFHSGCPWEPRPAWPCSDCRL